MGRQGHTLKSRLIIGHEAAALAQGAGLPIGEDRVGCTQEIEKATHLLLEANTPSTPETVWSLCTPVLWAVSPLLLFLLISPPLWQKLKN